jgi:hypothetical protein
MPSPTFFCLFISPFLYQYHFWVNFPHFNHLTGLRWKRLWGRRGTNLNEAQSQAWIAAAMERRAPCAIGKIGTSELLAEEYLDRWIQLPWPPNASWRT